MGALETPTVGLDGETHRMGNPFREAQKCWDHLNHLTVHRYHVTDDESVDFGAMRSDDRQQTRDWEAVRIRDAHVAVQPDQMVDVVDRAMTQLAAQRAAL